MEKNDNINITLLPPSDEQKSIEIPFSVIFKCFKKFFSCWLIVAIIVGLATAGISILRQKSSYVGDVEALIQFDYSGIEKGLDPDGNEFDITKIKSPAVIEKALTSISIDSSKVDLVRNNIQITSVMPQSAVDEMNLYYKAYNKNLSLDAAKSLLSTSYYPNQYVISFDYFNSKYSVNQGTEILNAILESYSSYFFDTYNYNIALGSAVSVIDYKNYDYAEALNIFSTSLDDIEEYIINIKENDENSFRSSVTGYTFDDLLNIVSILKSMDLDKVTSYVTVNNVTNNDIETMISYYKYIVENLTKSKSIECATMDSINESIQKYERDPLVLVVGNETADNQDMNTAYDELMTKKIESQKKISKYNKDIKYYNKIIDSFEQSDSVNQSNIDETDKMLASLNEKVNTLITNVNKTTEEYYSKVAFANAFKILVPALGSETKIVSQSFVSFVLSEVIVFIIYILVSIAIVMVEIIDKNSKKSEENEENIDDKEETKADI
jgi:hypothetical protein